MPSTTEANDGRRVVRVVFTALLIDLLAFTMPLPLFPRLMEDFVRQEALDPSASPTLLSRTMSLVRTLRAYLFSFASATTASGGISGGGGGDSRWDLTLLGGLLASLFSFCQFLISPYIGRLSDRYGRRPVLLVSMAGNLLSALLWLVASRFEVYALSRVVGGLSEGNVQLSIACITDVTTPSERARALALVGAAFSLAFTAGPSIGAYLSQRAFGPGGVVSVPGGRGELRLNAYAVPAAMTVVLLAFETAYLWAFLPETRGWRTTTAHVDADAGAGSTSTTPTATVPSPKDVPSPSPSRPLASPSSRLSHLSTTHLLFLFCFSGAEFTLTFLTHALFTFSNAQNGRLLGFVGLVSAALSGLYVRRLKGTTAGSARLTQRGMRACAAALALLALLPGLDARGGKGKGTASALLLWGAAALLAFVSASVVTSLSALASAAASSASTSSSSSSSSTSSSSGSGAALGSFRSQGQLGRALGPLVFTALWWTAGPAVAYALGAGAVLGVAGRMGSVVRDEDERERERERKCE
ncbi:hypothetical protein JCM9279_001429 [Rhodotorula babjevae]